MITVLKESEITGKAEFIPTLESLKGLSDMVAEIVADNTDRLDRLKQAIDVIMVSVAELQEAGDAEAELKNSADKKGVAEDVEGKN